MASIHCDDPGINMGGALLFGHQGSTSPAMGQTHFIDSDCRRDRTCQKRFDPISHFR